MKKSCKKISKKRAQVFQEKMNGALNNFSSFTKAVSTVSHSKILQKDMTLNDPDKKMQEEDYVLTL